MNENGRPVIADTADSNRWTNFVPLDPKFSTPDCISIAAPIFRLTNAWQTISASFRSRSKTKCSIGSPSGNVFIADSESGHSPIRPLPRYACAENGEQDDRHFNSDSTNWQSASRKLPARRVVRAIFVDASMDVDDRAAGCQLHSETNLSKSSSRLRKKVCPMDRTKIPIAFSKTVLTRRSEFSERLARRSNSVLFPHAAANAERMRVLPVPF